MLRFRQVGWVRGGQGAFTRLFDGNLVFVNGNPGGLRWKTLCFQWNTLCFSMETCFEKLKKQTTQDGSPGGFSLLTKRNSPCDLEVPSK